MFMYMYMLHTFKCFEKLNFCSIEKKNCKNFFYNNLYLLIFTASITVLSLGRWKLVHLEFEDSATENSHMDSGCVI